LLSLQSLDIRLYPFFVATHFILLRMERV